MKRSKPVRSIAALLCVMPLLSPACTTGSEGSGDDVLLNDFITAYVSEYLAPASQAWSDEAATFANATEICAEVTPAAFRLDHAAGLRTSFEAAFVAYKRLTLARFGPFDENPFRIAVKADGWPVDTGRIDDAVALAPDAAALRDFGADQRGFPGIGYVLSHRLADPELSDADFASSCEFLRAASGDLTFLAEEWQRGFFDADTGYTRHLKAPTGEEMLNDAIDVLTLLLQNTLDAVYLLREESLQGPRSAGPDGTPDITRVEQSATTGLSFAAIDATLDAARQVMLTGETMSTGVDAIYATRQDTARADIEAVFAAVDAARAEVDGTLADALIHDLPDVDAYIESLRGLTTLLRADIMSTLGLTVSFTDADGD